MSYLYGIFAVAGWVWLVISAPLFYVSVKRHDAAARRRGFEVVPKDAER